MTEWSLSFKDVSTVYDRLKARGIMGAGDEKTAGRLLYIGAVGLAIRRSGTKLIMSELFQYAAEWFQIPLSDLTDSFDKVGCGDPAQFWQWLTRPERRENN